MKFLRRHIGVSSIQEFWLRRMAPYSADARVLACWGMVLDGVQRRWWGFLTALESGLLCFTCDGSSVILPAGCCDQQNTMIDYIGYKTRKLYALLYR